MYLLLLYSILGCFISIAFTQQMNQLRRIYRLKCLFCVFVYNRHSYILVAAAVAKTKEENPEKIQKFTIWRRKVLQMESTEWCMMCLPSPIWYIIYYYVFSLKSMSNVQGRFRLLVTKWRLCLWYTHIYNIHIYMYISPSAVFIPWFSCVRRASSFVDLHNILCRFVVWSFGLRFSALFNFTISIRFDSFLLLA